MSIPHCCWQTKILAYNVQNTPVAFSVPNRLGGAFVNFSVAVPLAFVALAAFSVLEVFSGLLGATYYL